MLVGRHPTITARRPRGLGAYPDRVDHDEAEAVIAEDWIPLNSRDSTIDGERVHFYRQPGGCVEASIQGEEEVDILHFCGDDAARTFLREFNQFINDTAPHVARRDAAAAVIYPPRSVPVADVPAP